MVLHVQPTINESDEELMIRLRCVIITRSRDGATLDEIIEDFLELTGKHLLDFFHTRTHLMAYLILIDGVWYSTEGARGTILWFCSTPKTKHIVEMIKQQKPSRSSNYRHYMPRDIVIENANSDINNNHVDPPVPNVGATTTTSTAWENNWRFGMVAETPRPRRPFHYRRQSRTGRHRPYVRPAPTSYRPTWRRTGELDYCKYGPSYHQHQLLGDDFFLAIAKWELKYSFDPGHDIEMSGLCISGLTLSEAAKRIQVAPYIAGQVVINVGTVDLLHGRVMIDLIHDFEQLMARFRDRNVEPIVTTLTPIANSGGRTAIAERLLKFNEYIRRTCPRFIDLWRYFVNPDGSCRFELYQPEPRSVSGSIRPHVLWNKLGRHHLLDVLGHEIATHLTCGLTVQLPAPHGRPYGMKSDGIVC
uniref:OSK domain-containing protein n=1 Tax=Anopheles atroparvus TaxID=41427 RepID=A0AAG5CYX4_ANOAO